MPETSMIPGVTSNQTFFIGGYYGAGNIGDEAILECMLRDLRAQSRDIQFIVTSWNPEQTERQFRVRAVHWKDIAAIEQAVEESDLVILGGGGLFQDYWGIEPETYLRSNYHDITAYGSIPLVAKLKGIPSMIYSVGIGPLNTEIAKQHTRYAFENCSLVTLRDQQSLSLLIQTGYDIRNRKKSRLQVLADPVFSLKNTREDTLRASEILEEFHLAKHKQLLGVNLRYWDFSGPLIVWIRQVADGLNQFLEENDDFHVIFIPFHSLQENEYTNDAKAFSRLAGMLKYPDRGHLIDAKLTPRLAQALIQKCRILLGMRLHSLIMGINTGTPVVGLPYDPKVTSLMMESGLDDYRCSAIDVNPAELVQKLEKALENEKPLRLAMDRYRENAIISAKKNAELAIELVKKTSKIPVSFVNNLTLGQAKIIQELDNQIAEKTQRILDLDQQVGENFQVHTLLSGNILSLRTEIETLSLKMNESLERNRALNEQIIEYHKKQTSLIENNQIHQQQLAEYKIEYASLSEKNQALQMKFSEFQQAQASLEERNQSLQIELSELQKVQVSLVDTNQTLQDKLTIIQNDNASLQEKNQSSREEILKLQQNQAVLLEKYKAVHMRVKEFKQNETILLQNNLALAEQLKINQEQRRALANENQVLKDQNGQNYQSLVESNEKSNFLAEQLDSERSNSYKQSERLLGLDQQLNSIYSSKAWKLISLYYRGVEKPPLRNLHRLITGKPHIGLKNEDEFVNASDKNAPNEGSELPDIIKKLNQRKLKGVFLLTSAFEFDPFYNQRVINLAKFAGRNHWGVIFIAWRWSKEEKIQNIGKEVFQNVFQIPVDSFLNNLSSFKELNHTNKFFVLEFPHPNFFRAGLTLKSFDFQVLYEIIDDWEEFFKVGQADWYDESIEHAVIYNADFLTAVSQPLVDKFSDIRQDIRLIRNGFEPELLGEGNRNIAKREFDPHEIHIGYFGHLTESWFDWDFVYSVVDFCQENGENVKFHIIGYGEPERIIKSNRFPDKLIFHGRVDPEDLYKHVRDWDLAMIPFKPGKLAQAVDPIKIYEYLFFGLPVIVTGIDHLDELPTVKVVATADEFVNAIYQLKSEKTSTLKENKWLRKKVKFDPQQPSHESEALPTDGFVRDSTWERRFTELIELMEANKWIF